MSKKNQQNLRDFVSSPAGMVICFIVLFYALTFSVYYFYSPGPEERKQAELQKQREAELPHITQAEQNSSITVSRSETQAAGAQAGTQQALIQ